MRKPITINAIALGTVSGLLLMVFAGLLGTGVLWIGNRIGFESGELGTLTVLALALLAGQLSAGYVAGRLSRPAAAGRHGSLAALGLYAVFATLSLLAGSPAGYLTLGAFAVIAVAMGRGGGALGGRSRR